MEGHANINVRLGHVCLEVSNLAKSRTFYVPVLTSMGFEIIFEDGDSIGLGNGTFSLWLNKPESRRVEKNAPSGDEFVVADHIALLVPDRTTVDKSVETLARAGFKPLFAPEEHPEFRPGYYSVSFSDFENNVIEFYTIENPVK